MSPEPPFFQAFQELNRASDNKLSGFIPETFFKLSHLETLNLSENDIYGKIPAQIGTLKQLNELNLANNKFTGEIPDEIGNLPVLNYLDLSCNSFSGNIPSGLDNLMMNKLNLSNNHISGPIPSAYAKEVYRDSFLGNPDLCGGFTHRCPQNIQSKSVIIYGCSGSFSYFPAQCWLSVYPGSFLSTITSRTQKNDLRVR
ncbi:hypothetical protein L2E82_12418 [Cichorium intybus]|uniref:Uncharacterized protein n=1 Tax=Cichorium intybus TaxID=13427 RepID=A0ACB9GH50_CICIN|nr:hypothetical protein L2E82_12418 [Cichorium intybus]